MPQIRTTPDPDGVAPGALLSVRDLATHFDTVDGVIRAVDGATFDIPSGRIVGMVGETGCGKSVMARSILRIVEKPGRIVRGEILLRDGDDYVDLAGLEPYGRRMRQIRGGRIGLVFQEPMTSFSPVHTVGNQLLEAVQLHDQLNRRDAHDRAVELLEVVGLPRPEEQLSAYSWQLSGGLRQRAMIAMALAGRPELLIADEPTTALDVITQAQVLTLIRDLQERTGLAILLITHDLGVVAEMADEVVVMYLGRVVERGPVDEIFHAPQHPYTRALMRSIPSSQTKPRVRLTAIKGSVPHPLQRPSGCSFHDRCTFALPDVCTHEAPALRDVGPSHQLECHLPDEVIADIAAADRRGRPRHEEPTVLPAAEPATLNGSAPATPRRALLEVADLNKSFSSGSGPLRGARGRVPAVNDVSFTLYEGETLALVGESGSGKTTVARCVMRDHSPDSGRILFSKDDNTVIDLAGLSKKQVRPLRSGFQMVFQDPFSSLNPRMTVFSIIGEPLLVHGMHDRQERVERVRQLMELVGLRPEYMQRFPHAFSGGQRQRIGIARALALNPQLVIADEPVSALDVSVQSQILNLLLDLQQRLRLTYLFVSHDLSVVRHISDRIAVMYAGQIVELGERDDVLEAPKHPYTAALLAAIPKTDPRLRSQLKPPRGAVANLANLPTGCSFHPRCPFAVERCKVEKPELQEVGGRQVRCHRAQELALAGLPHATERSPLAASEV
ncbi:MAG TPA: ABC transporter ATP-binding protein [Jatrophihabitans sp.]|jgi:peptide/nickel transport system ATP-binding protein|nr:ABC transporter ATP-binding protein [Jatrophihabitans sp.]